MVAGAFALSVAAVRISSNLSSVALVLAADFISPSSGKLSPAKDESERKSETNEAKKNCGRNQRRGPRAFQINGGYLGRRREIVSFGFSQDYEESVDPADA